MKFQSSFPSLSFPLSTLVEKRSCQCLSSQCTPSPPPTSLNQVENSNIPDIAERRGTRWCCNIPFCRFSPAELLSWAALRALGFQFLGDSLQTMEKFDLRPYSFKGGFVCFCNVLVRPGCLKRSLGSLIKVVKALCMCAIDVCPANTLARYPPKPAIPGRTEQSVQVFKD